MGQLTEIMPGRPTKLHHRHPIDTIRRPLDAYGGDPLSSLHALTITAAEQQTMNFYMTIGNRFQEPIARALYLEIAAGGGRARDALRVDARPDAELVRDAGAARIQRVLPLPFLHAARGRCAHQTDLGASPGHGAGTPPAGRRDDEDLRPSRSADDPAEDSAGAGPVREQQGLCPERAGEPGRSDDGRAGVRPDVRPAEEPSLLPASGESVNAGGIPSEEIIAEHKRAKGSDYRFQSEGEHPVPQLEKEDA